MTKDEEKAQVLNAFFASAFNSKLSCSVDTQPPELEHRDGEQNKAPTIQEEKASDQLHHSDTHAPMGQMGSTQGYRGSWQKWSPSHFPSFTSSPG